MVVVFLNRRNAHQFTYAKLVPNSLNNVKGYTINILTQKNPSNTYRQIYGLFFFLNDHRKEYFHNSAVQILTLEFIFCPKKIINSMQKKHIHFSKPDNADVVWGDQPGLTTQMKQLQSFQNRIAKKISKGKMTSAEALTSLQWVPLHARRFGHRCCLVQDAMKGEIPEHLDVFKSTMSQQHGYNTRNGYMPVISKPRTEWGKNKTYYKVITDWASLPSELKKLMPKRIFKYKLKQFLLDYF